ncbi:MAG: hypothetical protein J5781_02495 [Clostridia bacterium]|nr:hypothetical protein [Clostridia bacterium]
MKYLKETCRYLFSKNGLKKWLYFLLFSIIPAALIAHALPIYRLFFIIKETEALSFGQIWVTYFAHKGIILTLILAFFANVFFSACLCSSLTYHMRIGQFGLPRFFTCVNNNFFPCISRTVTVGALMVVCYSVFILFDVLWNIVLNSVAAIIASAFVFVLMVLLFTYLLSTVTLWLPTMVLTGQKYQTALATAFYQSRDLHKKYFMFDFVLVVFLMGISVLAYYTAAKPLVSWAITTVAYVITIIFIHVFWFVSFFDFNQLTRADLTVSSFKRRL